MKFIKQHSFSLSCASAALIAVALGFWGYTRAAVIEERLATGEQLCRQLRSSGRGASFSVAAIDQAATRIEELQRVQQKLQRDAEAVNARPQLIPDFFPTPEEGREIEFQEAYRQAINQFTQDLNAGQLPSSDELRNWETMIEEEIRQANEPGGFNPLEEYGEDLRDLVFDADARASIWHARQCHVYATEESFERLPTAYETREGVTPELFDLWAAQLSLWIQQDFIQSIKEMNDEAAQQAPDGPEKAWVGLLPIKQIVGIRTTDYVYEGDEDDAPLEPLKSVYSQRQFNLTMDVGRPTIDPELALTGHGGGGGFEVQHARLVVVMDPRKLPQLIDRILKRNLTTLLSVRYQDVPVSGNNVGLLYGPDPVIQVELDFAFHWLNSIYEELIPGEE